MLNVGDRTHRTGELWTLAVAERQAQAHGVGDGQDVREQDGGVQRETGQRLQRDFTGQFRGLAEAHEVAGAGAGGAVFRQIAARLAHQPDRCDIDRLSAQGAQQAVIVEGGGHEFSNPFAESLTAILCQVCQGSETASMYGWTTETHCFDILLFT